MFLFFFFIFNLNSAKKKKKVNFIGEISIGPNFDHIFLLRNQPPYVEYCHKSLFHIDQGYLHYGVSPSNYLYNQIGRLGWKMSQSSLVLCICEFVDPSSKQNTCHQPTPFNHVYHMLYPLSLVLNVLPFEEKRKKERKPKRIFK